MYIIRTNGLNKAPVRSIHLINISNLPMITLSIIIHIFIFVAVL